MKAFNTIVKVVVALAAVAGAVYVAATYGEKIVAWAKKVLASFPCQCRNCDCSDEPVEEIAVEEPEAAQAPVEETAEEAPAEEPAVEDAGEDAIVADETDFEG